jgi:hypothetical protein
MPLTQQQLPFGAGSARPQTSAPLSFPLASSDAQSMMVGSPPFPAVPLRKPKSVRTAESGHSPSVSANSRGSRRSQR